MTTICVVALAIVAVANSAVIHYNTRRFTELLGTFFSVTREERAELANRLQHPQVYQPTPADREEVRRAAPPSGDDAVLAKIGTIVPGDLMGEDE